MVFLLLSVWLFSGFLIHCVTKFLKWTPELSESYTCLWIAVYLLIFLGVWRLGSSPFERYQVLATTLLVL